MTNSPSTRSTYFPRGRRFLLALCVTALAVGGTIGRGVPAAFAAATTTLAVSAVTGSYGGTVTVSATLTSGAVDIAGESVDFGFGGKDLGTAVTGDDGVASISGVSLSGIDAGTDLYGVNALFDGDINFNFALGSNDLTVAPAPLTITADDQSKAYGAALPTLTAAYSGFQNGETLATSDVTGSPSLSTTATPSSPVSGSPYSIAAAQGSLSSNNYSFGFAGGSLTVTPAPLTITADDQTMVYGAALPTLNLSYSGFLNGDTSASLTTPPSLTTTATVASHVAGSPYAITASGAMDPNYTITNVDGSLTIIPAPLTITADNQTMAQGAAVPALTASYTGFVNGDTSASATQPTCTTTATSTSAAGTYPITCAGAVAGDYAISNVAGTLTISGSPVTNNPPSTITKITPVLSWATPAAIPFGTGLGADQLNATTAVPGTFTYSSPAGTVLPVGTQLLTVLFTPLDTADYNAASALVYLTVDAAPPVVAAAASTAVAPTVTAPLTPTTTSPTPVPSVATPLPTPVATQPAVVGLVVHNNARTEVGGRTHACDLAGNTNGAKERGCEIVSSVSAPGAAVSYTLTYADGSTQHFTDTADRRGHSLHVFNVAYRPAAAAGQGTGRTTATILVQATVANGAVLAPVRVRFAVIR